MTQTINLHENLPQSRPFGPLPAISAIPAILALGLALTGCSLADLREDVRDESAGGPHQLALEIDASSAEERGRAVLARVLATYGSQERWLASGGMQTVFRDAWPVWWQRQLMMPWHRQNERTRWTALHGSDNARVDFLEGEWAGQSWGIQDGDAYRVDQAGTVEFGADDTIAFWLPAIQYLIELPFRLQAADYVRFAGTETVDGKLFERVLLSWGDTQPNDRFDQYLIYVDPQTGRLEHARFTIREMGGFMTGAIRYSDFRETPAGLLTAYRYTLLDRVGGEQVMHDMILEGVEYDAAELREHVLQR